MNNSYGNRPETKPLAKAAFVFSQIVMFVFGIPFLAFGVFAFYQVWKNWHGNIHDAKHNPIATLIFGLLFFTFGFGIMFSAITAARKRKKAEEKVLKQTDGGKKPWLLRPDWAAGKIKSSATAPVKFFLLWSFLALALSAPAVWHIPEEWQKGNRKILIALVFPAAAFYLLGYSFVKWRSRRRFGDCFFELAQIPAPLGGTLEGLIQTGAQLKLENGLQLKISCIRRVVSGAGEHQSTNENILWQDEKIFKASANLPDSASGHSGIPVFFKLPADQPECFARGNESVSWRLEAKSKMRGPDFSVAFDVPVFKVAGAIAAGADEADPTIALQEPVDEIRRDENSRIKISAGPNGREFYFPAARNIGMAAFMSLFMLIFSAAAVFVYRAQAPILFPIVFGLIGVLLILGTFNLWFKSSRVTIDSNGVTVVNRWLIFSRTRKFDAGDIARLELQTGMTSGTQTFQDIKLITSDCAEDFETRKARYQRTGERPSLKFKIGNPTIASSISSKPEADWLVQEMTKALGRRPENFPA